MKMDDYEKIYRLVLANPIFEMMGDKEIIEHLIRRCYEAEKENNEAQIKLEKIARVLSPENWIKLYISEDDLPF